MLSRKEVNATIKAIKSVGLTASYDDDYGEYRVNYAKHSASHGYFTSDSDDAINTAIDMAKRCPAKVKSNV